MTEGRFYANNDKVLPLLYAQSVVHMFNMLNLSFQLKLQIITHYTIRPCQLHTLISLLS